MKEKVIRAVILFLVICSGAYLCIVMLLDWGEISSKGSPDGGIVAYHMQSLSEAGAAPYGDHVVLVRKYKLLGQYFSEPVLAGYCRNGPEYQWLDNHTLQIKCDAKKIMKKVHTSDGIRIEYAGE